MEIKDPRHFVIVYSNTIILLKHSKPSIRDRFCNIPGIYLTKQWFLAFQTSRIPGVCRPFRFVFRFRGTLHEKRESFIRSTTLLIAGYVCRHEIKIQDTLDNVPRFFLDTSWDKSSAKVNACTSAKRWDIPEAKQQCWRIAFTWFSTVPNKFATHKRISFQLWNFQVPGHLCSGSIDELWS